MTDRPILFSAPMVRALLEGRKTQTRRLAQRRVPFFKGSPHYRLFPTNWQNVRPGDRLWVRETLQQFNRSPLTAQYAATLTAVVAPEGHARHIHGAALWNYARPKMPAIHMPRWASRLTLEVTAVEMEHLQSITYIDAVAEGVEYLRGSEDPREVFRNLWAELHGHASWDANPVVVVLTFAVHNCNVDAMPKLEAA